MVKQLNKKRILRLRVRLISLCILTMLLIIVSVCLVISQRQVTAQRRQMAILRSQIGGTSVTNNGLEQQITALKQQLNSKNSDYSNLSKALLNDPAHSTALNQILTDLQNKKLLIPVGSKCDTGDLLNPSNMPAYGSALTPSQKEQGVSTSACLKIVDDTFIGQYVNQYNGQ